MIVFTTKKNRPSRDVQAALLGPVPAAKVETLEERHLRTDTAGEKRRARQTKLENELI